MYFIPMIEDISERKLMEEKRIESEQTFRYTFDQSPLGAAIADLDYRYTRVNEALCRFLEYTAEEILSRNMPEITYPDDIEPNLRLARQLAAGEIAEYHTDKRYVRKYGKIVWGRLSSRMVRDAAGKPLYYLVLVEDIDERKRMEEALRESEAMTQSIMNSINEFIALIDLDGRIKAINEASVRK